MKLQGGSLASRSTYAAVTAIAVAATGFAAWMAGDIVSLFEDAPVETPIAEAFGESAPSVLLPAINTDAKQARLAGVSPPRLESPAFETARFFVYYPVSTVNFGPRELPGKPRERPTTALLNDAQIANIKSRLRLNASQAQFWPDVERSLRKVVADFQEFQKRKRRGDDSFDLESENIAQLKAAATRLMTRLRDDQKSEIAGLAHLIGLDKSISELGRPEKQASE